MVPYGAVLLYMACLGLQAVLEVAGNPRRSQPTKERYEDDKPLFLTPYIQNRSIKEGQERSLVELFKTHAGVDAHSGYITVNESTGSHLFFLYIKAKRDHRIEAPLLLWLEGSPGKSALFGQFLEGGPLGIGVDGHLYRRQLTLQEEANIVYLDHPVGGGYSFTTDQRGFARTLGDITASIEEFLRQFLELFPENKNSRFYAIGESYGGRSALGTVDRLRVNGTLPLRVSGAILGVPFVAPLLDQMDSSDYLYNTGMIDARGHQLFSERFGQIKQAAEVNRTIAAGILHKTVFTAMLDGEPSLYQQLTGYTDHASVLLTKPKPETLRYEEYITSDAFKRSIHVAGGVPLQTQMSYLELSLAQSDFFTDISDTVAEVLDSTNVLLYTAQFDTVFPAVNTDRYLRKLKWSGLQELESAKREPWYTFADAHRLAGYVTRVRNLTYALVSMAGHRAAFDEPVALFDLMYRFIHGKAYNKPRWWINI